ncbi:MAG: nucleotide exchange factor GrpE [Anaerocolumna sp.]
MLHLFSNRRHIKNNKDTIPDKSIEEIIQDSMKVLIDKSAEIEQRLASKQTELFDKFQKRINKQNAMLEELIEMAEENKEDKLNLEKALDNENKQKNGLLNLILQYQEYLDLINSHLTVDSNYGEAENFNQWKAQLDLVYSELDHNMSLNGIEKISDIKVKVNTELHQIIETTETDHPYTNETVSKILVPGCIYHGTVIRKAKIIAYIYKGELHVENNRD